MPAPADLVMVGRIARPRALFETLAGWAGVPASLEQVLPDELRELGSIVSWDAPVELAAVLDPEASGPELEPLLVVSVGVPSPADALAYSEQRGYRVSEVAPGVHRVAVDDDGVCAVSAALGPTPARLVCGGSWRDVEALLPYATRGLPGEVFSSDDVHFELRAEPVRARYRDQIQSIRVMAGLLLRRIGTDDARVDRALSEVVYGLADEAQALALELDRLEVSLRLDEPARALDLDYALSLAGTGSVVGQIVREASEGARPAPDDWFKLPASGSSGSYSTAVGGARIEKVVRALAELADAYLEREKLGADTRKRIRDAVEGTARIYSSYAYVSGPLEKPPAGDDASARLAQAVGYYLGFSEVRADRITQWMGDIAKVLGDRAFLAWLKERHGLDAAMAPKLRSRIARAAPFEARATVYTLELPAALLETLMKDFEGRRGDDEAGAKAERKPAAKPGKLTFVVVPDGERTVVAVAADERVALDTVVLARGAAPPAPPPAPAPAPPRPPRPWSGPFGPLPDVFRWTPFGGKATPAELPALMAKLPQGGRTPLVSTLRAELAGERVRLVGRTRVLSGTLSDAGALVVLLSDGAGKPEPPR
nr:MAG: hypothetical protein DIU78_18620 [Pseudomonadota bacterium]